LGRLVAANKAIEAIASTVLELNRSFDSAPPPRFLANLSTSSHFTTFTKLKQLEKKTSGVKTPG
jgi:hypothetical protein